MANEDEGPYVAGLRAAIRIVIAESKRRREAGEMRSYYALNTALHAIFAEIDAAKAPVPAAPATPEDRHER